MGEHVGVQGQDGGGEIDRVVADDVVVVFKVGDHLIVAVFAVAEAEAAFDLDRIAGPVEAGRLAQERAAAAVEHAANQFALGIVVLGDRVFIHVEAGEAAAAPLKLAVVGVGQALQEEGGEALAVVEPVEHDGELFEVHPVAGHGNFDRFGLGVLLQMTFPSELVEVEDVVGAAQGVQNRPVEQVFGGVIGSVVAAPAGNTEQKAALIEVVVEEGAAALGLRAQ